MSVAASKEWPFIFSGHSVRQMLALAKSQTRRVPGPGTWSVDGGAWPRGWKFDLARARLDVGPSPARNDGPYLHAQRLGADTWHRLYPVVRVGHGLWVREVWGRRDLGSFGREKFEVVYRATDEEAISKRYKSFLWRSPIFMPRDHCRLAPLVTAMRVERVQQINEMDARAEGVSVVPFRPDEGFPLCDGYTFGADDGRSVLHPTASKAFAAGWDELHAEHPGTAFADDPWVLALTFQLSEAVT